MTYYISASGDDAAAGTSAEAAWRTLSRVNALDLEPGDRVLLEGGRTFSGTIQLDQWDAGAAGNPVTISSYGSGRATIAAGGGDGIKVVNAGGISISNLNVAGSGRTSNEGNGIAFINDLSGNVKLPYLRVDGVEISGFGYYGLTLDGNNDKSGFRDVRITNVVSHDNALAGIYVFGQFSSTSSGYAHEDVYIGWSRAYNNPGVSGTHLLNTGNGIVLSDVNRGMIERSIAHDNGWLSNSSSGGPVGIWAWDSNDITIQYNESYRNRTAGRFDGGGFDLDGGTTNSRLQYNYSHDNDGAGYLISVFGGARATSGNVVRFNISQNDGRKNGYAGIQMWGSIRDTEIYNNTIYTAPTTNGAPRALWVQTGTVDTKIYNNLFYAVGGTGLMDISGGQSRMSLLGNAYWTGSGSPNIRWNGANYGSVSSWRGSSGQETLDGQDVSVTSDPRVASPGGGGTIGNAGQLSNLTAYRPLDDSPLIGAGLNLSQRFGIDVGATDFAGRRLEQGRSDIGARAGEAVTSPPPPAPPESPVVLRVNAGGSTATTPDGRTFFADRSFDGPSVASGASFEVRNTDWQYLYYTRRFGKDFSFSEDVPNGTYWLYLNFAESYWTQPGQRVRRVRRGHAHRR
jgi:hypothetical protein